MKRGSLSARVALAETSIPEGPRRELRARRDGRRPRARRRRDPRRRPAAAAPRRTTACASACGSRSRRRATRPRALLASRSRRASGLDAATVELGGGTTTVRLFVPAVERPTTVTLESELEGGPRRRDELELLPQRRWRVHLVHHSHFDLGYTDPQALVLRHHLAYLDSALDLAAADDGFRWTIESNLPLERWLAARPRAARDELLDLVRSGRFEVVRAAVHACTPRRCRSTSSRGSSASRSELRRRHGLEIVTAMQTDVPGAPPGLPLVLAGGGRALPRGRAQLGVPRDAVPDRRRVAPARLPLGDRERQARARLAHGQPARHRVPRGQPARARRLVRRRARPAAGVPRRARARAATRTPARTRRSACPAGHPRAVPVRPAPPARAGPARRQRRAEPRAGGDRGRLGARVRLPAARPVDEPRLLRAARRAARRRARDVPRRLGRLVGRRARLGRARGRLQPPRAGGRADGTDAARHGRRARRRRPELDWAGEVDRVYERMALFDEHTWCAAHPGGDALTGRESGELQWQSKAALAVEARDRADALLDAAAARFRSGAATRSSCSTRAATRAPTSSSSSCRRAVSTRRPSRRRRRGARRAGAAARSAPPESSRNRPQGRLLSFVARDVPALGYRRFELVADGAAQPRGRAGPARERALPRRARRRGRLRAPSLLDRELGHDLVDAASAFGFGQVVRDLYGGPLQATARVAARRRAHLRAAGRRALRRADHVALDARRRDRRANACRAPVEERDRRCGRGRRASSSSRRPSASCAAIRRLDVSVRLVKHATAEKESVHVVFPFAARDPRVAYELTGGVGGGACVPGSRGAHARDPPLGRARGRRRDRRLGHARRRRSSSSATSSSRTRRTRRRSTARAPGSSRRGSTNNVWDTNFPLDAGRRGALRLRGLLRRARRGRPRARDRDRGRAHPTARRRARRDAPQPRPAAVCELDAPGVEVVMLAPRRTAASSCTSSRTPRTRSPSRVGGRELRIAPGDYVVGARRARPAWRVGTTRSRATRRAAAGSSAACPRSREACSRSTARPRSPWERLLAALPGRPRGRRPRRPSCPGARSSAARPAAPRTTRSSGACATAPSPTSSASCRVSTRRRSSSGPAAALVATRRALVRRRPEAAALAAVRRGEAPNVGQPAGARGTEQRLLFVDWPMLDRHKQALLPRIDRYVDLSDPVAPLWLAGDALRETFAGLARQPVPHAPHLPARAVGRSVAAARARRRDATRRTSPGRTS